MDATANGNTGAQSGNETRPDIIANSQEFDGDNDYIEVDPGGLQITGFAITIEAWARPTGDPHDFWHVYGAGWDGLFNDDGRYWQLFWDRGSDGWAARFHISGAERDTFTGSGHDNAWNYLASRFDGTSVRLFLDGNQIGSQSTFGNLDAISTPFLIGDNPVLAPREFEGLIDEVRISEVARSQPWLAAQYKSMTGNGFVLYGAEETY